MAESVEIENLEVVKGQLGDILDDLVFLDGPWKVNCFRCNKCKKLALDHSIPNCLHVFCKKCFQNLLDRPCPNCQRIIIEKRQDSQFESEFLLLKVECENKSNGCQEILLLANYLKHKGECNFSAISSQVTLLQLNELKAEMDGKLSKILDEFSQLKQMVCATQIKVGISEVGNLKQHLYEKFGDTVDEEVIEGFLAFVSIINCVAETIDPVTVLRYEVDIKLAEFQKNISEINARLNDHVVAFNEKIGKIQNQKEKSEEKPSVSDEIALPSNWWKEPDELDENAIIFEFTTPNIQENIRKGFASREKLVWSWPLLTSRTGLQFRASLFMPDVLEKLVLQLEMLKWGNFEEYCCRLVLLDRSESPEKVDVVSLFQINNHHPNKFSIFVGLVPLKTLTEKVWFPKESFVANNETYVKNDSLAIKMVFHSIYYVYKSLSCKSGVLIWQIPNFSVMAQDGTCPAAVESHAFYTGVSGYKMLAKLDLSGYLTRGHEYISLCVDFLVDGFNCNLPKSFQYLVHASILNPTDVTLKKDFFKECKFYPRNVGFLSKNDRCVFKKFIHRRSALMKVECLLLKIEVNC